MIATLKTVNGLDTADKIVPFVLRHMIEQRTPPVRGKRMTYKSNDGKSDPIGCLIPDRVYDRFIVQYIESRDVRQLGQMFAKKNIFLSPFQPQFIGLLENLRAIYQDTIHQTPPHMAVQLMMHRVPFVPLSFISILSKTSTWASAIEKIKRDDRKSNDTTGSVRSGRAASAGAGAPIGR